MYFLYHYIGGLGSNRCGSPAGVSTTRFPVHPCGQGQVATDAELQCLKVARLLRDVCGSRRPEPAHRHSPLAAGILSRPLPQCILSQTCPHPQAEYDCHLRRIFAFSGNNVLIYNQMTISGTYNSSVSTLILRGGV